jgi:hypothetical protein
LDFVSGPDGYVVEPEVVRHQRDNVLRLLVERHHIRAKVENPGGSVIMTATDRVDHERPTGYSTEMGNPDHLDLLDLDVSIREAIRAGGLTKMEVHNMLRWVDSMTDDQAAHFMHSRGSSRIRYRRRVDRSTEQARSVENGRMDESGALRPVPHGQGDIQAEVPAKDGE